MTFGGYTLDSAKDWNSDCGKLYHFAKNPQMEEDVFLDWSPFHGISRDDFKALVLWRYKHGKFPTRHTVGKYGPLKREDIRLLPS